MHGNSRRVSSNQTGLHPDLETVVIKHLENPYQYPISAESKKLFSDLESRFNKQTNQVVLDSGCGTGASSKQLAELYPSHTVIGVDKSIHRLAKNTRGNQLYTAQNLILVQMDLVAFWLLAQQHDWQIRHHYILYPNPWPKQQQLQRRWHGHAIWPSILALGGRLTVRTNWLTYAQEFEQALLLTGKGAELTQLQGTEAPETPFQQKYAASGHNLYQLQSLLS